MMQCAIARFYMDSSSTNSPIVSYSQIVFKCAHVFTHKCNTMMNINSKYSCSFSIWKLSVYPIEECAVVHCIGQMPT